jgi:hypothetical protein
MPAARPLRNAESRQLTSWQRARATSCRIYADKLTRFGRFLRRSNRVLPLKRECNFDGTLSAEFIPSAHPCFPPCLYGCETTWGQLHSIAKSWYIRFRGHQGDMDMSQPKSKLSRRTLFAGAGTAGAIAAAASLLPGAVPENTSETQANPAPEKGGGYQLTEHVKRYYKSALI